MPDYSHFDQVKDLRERMDLVIGVLPHLNDEDLAFASLRTEDKLRKMQSAMDSHDVGSYMRYLDICMALPISKGGISSDLITKKFLA